MDTKLAVEFALDFDVLGVAENRKNVAFGVAVLRHAVHTLGPDLITCKQTRGT